VEEVLLSHSAVAEAAVVGHRDESRGEVVVAFVVLQPDHQVRPDELRSFCRDRGLVPFKVPRHVVVADSLPRSPTGKVLKRVLAETPLNTPPGSA
jgi:acyl-coenzyme A synthetase/AMP-(fatty) acid ligase